MVGRYFIVNRICCIISECNYLLIEQTQMIGIYFAMNLRKIRRQASDRISIIGWLHFFPFHLKQVAR